MSHLDLVAFKKWERFHTAAAGAEKGCLSRSPAITRLAWPLHISPSHAALVLAWHLKRSGWGFVLWNARLRFCVGLEIHDSKA